MALQLTPFIMLDGSAEEAIRFYEEALHGKLVFKQTFGEGPEDHDNPLPAHTKDRIAHSVLKIEDAELMCCDIVPGEPLHQGNQVTICLTASDADQAEQLFNALQEGGQVETPLAETYFSPVYGVVTDKFGVTFLVFTKRQR
ncbi:VOC family protein [Paenibacillus solisilvae]|uniref:VOC family protein n=1 Tax=Paenibacillus solisilvae TaxID=2486751 RepID=A0ABW0VZ82_9BACL